LREDGHLEQRGENARSMCIHSWPAALDDCGQSGDGLELDLEAREC
jgi:hypothetical protein